MRSGNAERSWHFCGTRKACLNFLVFSRKGEGIREDFPVLANVCAKGLEAKLDEVLSTGFSIGSTGCPNNRNMSFAYVEG